MQEGNNQQECNEFTATTSSSHLDKVCRLQLGTEQILTFVTFSGQLWELMNDIVLL